MILLLISLVIAFIAGFIVFCINEDWTFLMIVSIIVTFGLVFFGGLSAIDSQSEKVVKRDVTELIALNDGSSVSGRMFLGSGSIDGDLVYKYAMKKGDGYAIDFEKANDIDELRYIKDGSKPRIERTEVVYKSTFTNFMTAPFFDTAKYIYVPEGTIQETFNIDLN